MPNSIGYPFTLPHIASRLFDRPLAISQQKASIIANAILPRMLGELRFDTPRVRAEVGERFQPVMTKGGTIAVLPILGTLVHRAGAMDAESGLVAYHWIEHEFVRALNDWHVDGILLDIDSPGGEVNGLLDLGDLIREGRSKKAVYAVADDFALSAAYLLASAAERVFLTQTASVESVGSGVGDRLCCDLVIVKQAAAVQVLKSQVLRPHPATYRQR